MWLLPALTHIGAFAVKTFYRFHVSGGPLPSGPVLLVANHQNGLVDPAAVAAAAVRPVRFLAKAPLLSHPLIGWLVRGVGAIAVYRRKDDPTLVGRNEETFREVHETLASGAAVALFPEGISHNEPALVPLRTGAARMALGAAPLTSHQISIIPVGLTFRRKARFRSEALALIGEPVRWDDLAGCGENDSTAVAELTRRISDALRGVTINLQHWEDAPAVEIAAAIYGTEFELPVALDQRLDRQRQVADVLIQLRRDHPELVHDLSDRLLEFAKTLRSLGLRTSDLDLAPAPTTVARWTVIRLFEFLLLGPLFLLGALLLFVPYRLSILVHTLAARSRELRTTLVLLVGFVLFVAWIVAIACLVGWNAGPLAGLLTGFLLPPLGTLTLRLREDFARSIAEARRFLLARRTTDIRASLQERRHELAKEIEQVRLEFLARSDAREVR